MAEREDPVARSAACECVWSGHAALRLTGGSTQRVSCRMAQHRELVVPDVALEPDVPSLGAILYSSPVAQFKLWPELTWEVVREVDHLPQCCRRVVVHRATIAERFAADECASGAAELRVIKPASWSSAFPPVAWWLVPDQRRCNLHLEGVVELPQILGRSGVLEEILINVERVKLAGAGTTEHPPARPAWQSLRMTK